MTDDVLMVGCELLVCIGLLLVADVLSSAWERIHR